jgi:hypothetical protein
VRGDECCAVGETEARDALDSADLADDDRFLNHGK